MPVENLHETRHAKVVIASPQRNPAHTTSSLGSLCPRPLSLSLSAISLPPLLATLVDVLPILLIRPVPPNILVLLTKSWYRYNSWLQDLSANDCTKAFLWHSECAPNIMHESINSKNSPVFGERVQHTSFEGLAMHHIKMLIISGGIEGRFGGFGQLKCLRSMDTT